MSGLSPNRSRVDKGMFGYFGAQALGESEVDNFIDSPAGMVAFIATGTMT